MRKTRLLVSPKMLGVVMIAIQMSRTSYAYASLSSVFLTFALFILRPCFMPVFQSHPRPSE